MRAMGIELNATADSIMVSPLGKYVPKIHTLNPTTIIEWQWRLLLWRAPTVP